MAAKNPPTIPGGTLSAKEILLPVSKKTALIRRPMGRDMIQAEVLAGAAAGDRTYTLAILSRVTLLDGKALPWEDFLELDAEDIQELMGVDLGNASAPRT